MNRRTILAIGGSGLAALAGCTSSNDLVGGSGGSTSATATAQPEQARDRLQEANQHITEASDAFAHEASRMSSSYRGVKFDTDPILVAVKNAEEDLNAAAEVATEEQKAKITRYQTACDYLRSISNIFEPLATVLNALDTAISYERTGRYNDGADEIESAKTELEAAQSAYKKADETISKMGTDLHEKQEVPYEQLKSVHENLELYLNGIETLVLGRPPLDRGIAAYNEAIELYNNRDYDTAEDIFGDAYSHFGEAHGIYRAGEEDVGQSMRPTIIEQTCIANAYRSAADAGQMAAVRADAGDYSTAREYMLEADSAANRSCSA